jgi:ATP-dependent exoDNAse (exonuclease V) beta subunit
MSSNFVVYKSSAGSGKTYTLVKEYLKLALADSSRLNKAYKQILAVTFTNKAAAEMKERILNALKQISLAEQTPLANDLQNELTISETELQARCKELHQNLLHQYADFSVCTIDSFVYRLIKRFSIDLQLPANFSVDTDEETALWWAIDELLTNMKENKQLQNLLLNYTTEKVEEQKNWKIENEIFDLARPILIAKKDTKEAELLGKISLEDLLGIKKQLQESVHKTEHYLIAIADKAYLTIADKGIKAEDFRYGKSGFFSYFKKIKEKKFADEELANKYVNDAVNEDKWYTGKVANPAIDGIKENLRQLYFEVENYREKNIATYFLHKILLKNINALCLLNEIQELILKYKDEKNIVFISEFNKTISGFIQDEPVPFIYERLGDRYKHYLIDEFQDTSALQWLNLLPLVHNSLSEGKFCMIVGDGKQSIYRWRGADVEQFVNLPEIKTAHQNQVILEQQKALESNYVEKQLNTNRRSFTEVISFNNNLFQWLSATYLNEEHKKVYENSSQQAFSKQGGRITLSFIDKETEDKDDIVLQKTLTLIQEALANKYAYNDIAVLTRNNRHGSTIAQFLMHQGIPVVSSDSLLLKTCAEVNFLISFFNWLTNTNNGIAACAILSYLKENLNYPVAHTHLQQTASTPYKLNEVLRELNPEINISHLSALPLFEICTELIRIFKIEDKNPLFVNFFLDEVASFNERENASIYLFLQWWDKKRDNLSVKIPQNTNAVKILTIHASKGLEFPVLIFPFADWELGKPEQILIDTSAELAQLPVALVRTGKELEKTNFKNYSEEEEQKQILDNLNLLYVACTRAISALHIISREKKRGNCLTNWLQNFIKERLAVNGQQLTFVEIGIYPAAITKTEAKGYTLNALSYRDIHQSIAIKLTDYDFDAESKRTYGIALHTILANIHTEKDIDAALHKSLLQGNISSSQTANLKSQITNLVQHPRLKEYFSDNVQVKNEVEMFLANGDIIRPDRVVTDHRQHTIIDFKTGEKSPSHIKQLQLYKHTLSSISPKNVKAFLVYLPNDEVVEVV